MVGMNEPFNIDTEVPIQMDMPIQIEIEQTPLATSLQSISNLLTNTSEQMNLISQVMMMIVVLGVLLLVATFGLIALTVLRPEMIAQYIGIQQDSPHFLPKK
jgi:hypothetical protein